GDLGAHHRDVLGVGAGLAAGGGGIALFGGRFRRRRHLLAAALPRPVYGGGLAFVVLAVAVELFQGPVDEPVGASSVLELLGLVLQAFGDPLAQRPLRRG